MWSARTISAALLTNAAMGVLYLWSLFLTPLQGALEADRAVLSVVPALALVCVTLGMVVHDWVLRRLPPPAFAVLAFGCAGGGHLLFGLRPTLGSLMLGYGVVFGFGCGLGYGLALALATRQPRATQSLAVGLTVAAFALGGILAAATLPPVTAASVATTFLWIGGGLCASGLVVAVLVGDRASSRPAEGAPAGSVPVALLSPAFLKLGLAFFILCYLGLMIVSHAAGILAGAGVPATSLYLGPIVLNLGYLFGSLLGGQIVEAFSGRWSLAGANVVAAAGVLALLAAPSPWIALTGAALIGLVFGGSSSLMPVLIGEQFGIERIGTIYGKLMVAYGLAGLLAPWLTAILSSRGEGYAPALIAALVLAAVGVLVATRFKDAASSLPAR